MSVIAPESMQKEKGLIISVGYVFCYHPAIERIQSILKEHGHNDRLMVMLEQHANVVWPLAKSTGAMHISVVTIYVPANI